MKKLRLWINNLKLRTKMMGLYLFGILLPVLLTDSMVLAKVLEAEEDSRRYQMEATADAVQYNLSNTFSSASLLAKNIGANSYIRSYLDREYSSPREYLTAYQQFAKSSFLSSFTGLDNTILHIYSDNDTIVNGGVFQSLSSVENAAWMQSFRESGRDMMLQFYYDNERDYVTVKRKVLLVSRLASAPGASRDQIMKIEIDYSGMARSIVNQNYEFELYICHGGRIIIANDRSNHLSTDFEPFQPKKAADYEKDITLYGETIRIVIFDDESVILRVLRENRVLFLALLLISFLVPSLIMMLIERSIRLRIQRLGDVFSKAGNDTLTKLPDAAETDEIGLMTADYNRMADRMNDLIETVYKNRLREQESDIARQRAELLALHSQIDPHFLFNALESIRMHALLNGEEETAQMVEKLAVMERQNVDWGSDTVTVRQEISFVSAYLELQKLRFGERLSYDIDVRENCQAAQIPRLTLVTFVENACVHSIEKKSTPGWIFLRVLRDADHLLMEIEDTGNGMSASFVRQLNEDMNHADIGMLQTRTHVGIINACLRLRMMTEGRASFLVESEEGIGTTVDIRIPLAAAFPEMED